MKRRLFAAVALLLGVAVGLLVGEGALRLFTDPVASYGTANPIHDIFHSPQTTTEFGLGYRPRLGTGEYDRMGLLRTWNAERRQFEPPYPYLKRPGVTRLLFVGDSVTRRGRLIEGLEAVYGDRRFEYWNAGVEGYNTDQQLTFYRRYNQEIEPDHVILTLHNNDFYPTPVVVRDAAGRLVSYEPGRPLNTLNPWLFQNSFLYRKWVQWTATRGRGLEMAETVRALEGFQQTLAAQGIRFTVLVVPILTPYESWREQERASREQALAALHELGIRHFDLLEPLERGLAEGIVFEETPGDTWHPSAAAGRAFARFLERRGLLAEPAESTAEPVAPSLGAVEVPADVALEDGHRHRAAPQHGVVKVADVERRAGARPGRLAQLD